MNCLHVLLDRAYGKRPLSSAPTAARREKITLDRPSSGKSFLHGVIMSERYTESSPKTNV
jgi:hypothetical protein